MSSVIPRMPLQLVLLYHATGYRGTYLRTVRHGNNPSVLMFPDMVLSRTLELESVVFQQPLPVLFVDVM